MTDHAIVIGIDKYTRDDWKLTAAARDAAAFANWVTASGAGRATKETLQLFLSPSDGKEYSTPVQPVRASTEALRRALFDYSKNGAEAADRLWFFYAGHGLSSPGGGADAAPVIVPDDVTELDYYLDTPIQLSTFLGKMRLKPPRQQLFFIDTCRGIVQADDAAQTYQHLHFDLSKLGDVASALASQAVLYATTAGQVANELGLHGLFSAALIEGLAGRGPELRTDPVARNHLLTFDALTTYTRNRVKAKTEQALKPKSGQALRPQRRIPTQDPTLGLFGITGDLELARFEQKPRAALRIYFDMREALTGTAGLIEHNEFEDTWGLTQLRGPDLREPIEWSVPFGVSHVVQIRADSYKEWRVPVVPLDDPHEVHAALERSRGLGSADGLESFALDDTPDVSETDSLDNAADLRSDLTPGAKGRLAFDSRDRHARVEVFDSQGRCVASEWQKVDLELPVGGYRLTVTLPGEEAATAHLFVTPKAPKIVLEPGAAMSSAMRHALDHLRMQPGDSVSQPSEAFGLATTTRIGSVLAWAAWAARFDSKQFSYGAKLRNIGIDPLPDDGAYVQVLLADSRGEGDGFEIAFGPAGEEVRIAPSSVPGLPGLARQFSAKLASHISNLIVSGPDVHATSLPVVAMSGYAMVIVIAREQDGAVDIHRYLMPLKPERHGYKEFTDDIRIAERNWHALSTHTPLFPGEAEAMLHPRRLDPLTLAVLGYRLHREGRLTLMRREIESLMQSGLPDMCVLAALEFEISRDHHLQSAANAGIPLVGDGYSLLVAWITARAGRSAFPPPIPAQPVLSGIWTTFDARSKPKLYSPRAFSMSTPQQPEWTGRIVKAVGAAALIEAPHSTVLTITGTGFVVAPGVLATSEHCVATADLPVPADASALAPGWKAGFERERISLQTVISRANRGPAIGRPWEILRVTLVRMASSGAAPVTVGWTRPRVGQRICVIGHPASDSRIPEAAVRAAFLDIPVGQKLIMPGTIVAVGDTSFKYECWTLNGASGGPVVDIETGKVIGLHYGGQYDEPTATKFGYGVPMSALVGDPMWQGVDIIVPSIKWE